MLALLLSSCTSYYNLRDKIVTPELINIPLDNFLVMVMYPDEKIETRVALETNIAAELKENGKKVSCGYTEISSYDNLDDQVDDIIASMKQKNAKNLLIFNPIVASEYSNTDYYNEVAIYRALGMESAEFWSSVESLAESAEASRFVIEVSVWNINVQKFVWKGTYDIKAPGGYDLQYAKHYSRKFVSIVLEDLSNE